LKLEPLLQYVDAYLGIADHPDYGTALNGLQVEGPADVATIVTAVDASQATIDRAIELGADLLIVHHGLFWDGLRPATGRNYRRLKSLFDHDLAVYSCHLPLDGHAEIGNCILLARAIGLEPRGRLGAYKGVDLGWWGSLAEPLTADELSEVVGKAVGGPVRVLPGGPGQIERVGVLTGGGGSFIGEASELGLDAYVTGEGAHHNYFDAEEFEITVLFAGHYATETFGVRALGEHLAERFDVEAVFIHRPTGL
jgi:dinuclear metal center YbgI/SA1388 family protein